MICDSIDQTHNGALNYQMLAGTFRKLLSPLISAVALILLFEEWLWEKLSGLMARIGKLPVFRQLESGLKGLSPYPALACLAVPWFLLLPAKISALWLLSHDHALAGIGAIILAKLGGTALVARIFSLTKNQALSIVWFNRLYQFVMRILTWAHNWIKQTESYQKIKASLEQMKLKLRSFRQQLKEDQNRKK